MILEKPSTRASLLVVLILMLPQISTGQTKFMSFAGYNTFNEIYVGVQSLKKSKVNFGLEFAYRHAIAQNAYYTWGPTILSSPYLSNSASGIGIRASLVSRPRHTTKNFAFLVFSLEYQALETTNLVDDPGYYAGTNQSKYSEFKESYNNIGVLVSKVIPIRKSNRLCFTYSWGIKAKSVSRHYSVEGRFDHQLPSNREETFWVVGPQLRFGLRYYFVNVSSTQ